MPLVKLPVLNDDNDCDCDDDRVHIPVVVVLVVMGLVGVHETVNVYCPPDSTDADVGFMVHE